MPTSAGVLAVFYEVLPQSPKRMWYEGLGPYDTLDHPPCSWAGGGAVASTWYKSGSAEAFEVSKSLVLDTPKDYAAPRILRLRYKSTAVHVCCKKHVCLFCLRNLGIR